jgi:hypothetical protein
MRAGGASRAPGLPAPTIMFAIAHAGHWALGMLEAAPVAVVLAAVGCKLWADRRAAVRATPNEVSRA